MSSFGSKKEFAPGIPLDRAIKPIPKVTKPTEWAFTVQKHDVKSGTHFDLRLNDPATGHAHSWAARYLPKPGETRLATQQPTHRSTYSTFSGRIESGYGKGDVELVRNERAEVLNAGDDAVRFNLYPGQGVEEYALRRTNGKQWLLQNVTTSRTSGPGQNLPSSKPSYKVKSPNQIDVADPNTKLQAKIDGAHSLFVFRKPGQLQKVFSYRPAERETGIIEHTHRLPGFSSLKTPSRLQDTILRGELYAVNQTGKALPAARVGGLLNAGVWKSRQKQEKEGKLVPVVFDVVRWQGKNVENEPYSVKEKMLDTVRELAPWLKKPRTASTPKEKKELLEDISSGKEPSTEEGVIEWYKDKPIPTKAKFLDEKDVYVRNIFPEFGAKRKGTMAGGFEYSMGSPKGPIVGRTGTGFSHAMKKDMIENPDKYIGLKARIAVQRAPANYAPRAPKFISFHLDQDMPESIKTACTGKIRG